MSQPSNFVDETDPSFVITYKPYAEVLVLINAVLKILARQSSAQHLAQHVGHFDRGYIQNLGIIDDNSINGRNRVLLSAPALLVL
mmetsp:Transcript_15163/g.26452  ORF Transcript_15163/g.26452 Transcript_15163/m.26452 type:complete len:85 (-) Transcript_15163:31-285(-)